MEGLDLFWGSWQGDRLDLPESNVTADNFRGMFIGTEYYSIARAVMSIDPTLRQFDAKGDHTIHPVGYFS